MSKGGTSDRKLTGGTLDRHPPIEVFRNLIRPELRTGWWLQYSARARIPALPTQGTASPRLDYTVAASGTYTLVIVLWSPWKAGITPDVQITIR